MTSLALLQLAAELRRRAAAASHSEKADLLFLAEEYETTAGSGRVDKEGGFSVKLPK